MLTNTYSKVLRFIAANKNCIVKAFSGESYTVPEGMSNNTNNMWYFTNYFVFLDNILGYTVSKLDSASYSGTYGVCFGDGTTPPTANDYKLSGTPILGLTITKTSVSTEDSASGTKTKTVTYTITNNLTSEVTISEVGLFGVVPTSNNGNKASKPILLERTLLDTPVTIPAGEVGRVVYTVSFNGLLD